jgi:hypothetical protein
MKRTLYLLMMVLLATCAIAQEEETTTPAPVAPVAPVVILAPIPAPVIVAPSIEPPLPIEVKSAMPILVEPPDPLAVGTMAEGWVWAMRYWSPPAEPRDLAGGRIQAQLGIGRWGVAFRGDVSGLPGEFTVDKPETFRSLEGHLAVHRNFAGAQGVKLGAAVGAGSGFSLEKPEGVAPVTPHSLTFGAGLHVSGPGWWVYGMYGQHQALPGSAGIVVYQSRLSDHTAAVGTFAIGAKGTYIAQFGVAVRTF